MSRRPKKLSDESVKWARDLFDSGLYLKEISKVTGISISCIQGYCSNGGWKRPEGWKKEPNKGVFKKADVTIIVETKEEPSFLDQTLIGSCKRLSWLLEQELRVIRH